MAHKSRPRGPCEWCEVNEHNSCARGMKCTCRDLDHPRQPMREQLLTLPRSVR